MPQEILQTFDNPVTVQRLLKIRGYGPLDKDDLAKIPPVENKWWRVYRHTNSWNATERDAWYEALNEAYQDNPTDANYEKLFSEQVTPMEADGRAKAIHTQGKMALCRITRDEVQPLVLPMLGKVEKFVQGELDAALTQTRTRCEQFGVPFEETPVEQGLRGLLQQIERSIAICQTVPSPIGCFSPLQLLGVANEDLKALLAAK